MPAIYNRGHQLVLIQTQLSGMSNDNHFLRILFWPYLTWDLAFRKALQELLGVFNKLLLFFFIFGSSFLQD